jgi:peptide/nickel transport system permease protein
VSTDDPLLPAASSASTQVGMGMGPSMPSAPGGGEFEIAAHAAPRARSQWQLFWRRFARHKVAVASIVILVLLVVVCFGASFFAPYPKNEQDILLGAVSPSGDHWLGTDQLGRDQLTELLYAGQISLLIGFAVAIISTIAGTVVGALAGYFGRATDQFLMRFTDLFLVVPSIAILALAIEYFGHSTFWIIMVLALLFWMNVARVVRGQVLSLREKEFVEAAKASGASPIRVIVRHIVPNMIGPILLNVTLGVAAAIITESTLSFLGFGLQPPQTSWGLMLSDAEGYVGTGKSYLLYAPGLAIMLTVLVVNFIGDGLSDAFDPQSDRN